MLTSHMNAIENHLVQISQIPANAGHTLHRGTPREAFIKEFLETHISSNIAIGTGEIIDSNSLPREPRNQFDIVLYKKNYPKLDFGGGISGFLIESVIATIEVKSILDQAGINQSMKAANKVKNLIPSTKKMFHSGWMPPKILNYVIAYSGPANISTVYDWMLSTFRTNNIPFPDWTPETKLKTAGTALDGIFILNKGLIKLDNTPLSLNNNNPNGKHTLIDCNEGNILAFFLELQTACNNLEAAFLDPIPYIANTRFTNSRTI